MVVYTSILFGLWGWLFTETLTEEGHVFSCLKADSQRWLLWHKYTNCSVCHAGVLALVYAICLTALSFSGTPITSLAGIFLTTLFQSGTIAMSVAKIMSLKF